MFTINWNQSELQLTIVEGLLIVNLFKNQNNHLPIKFITYWRSCLSASQEQQCCILLQIRWYTRCDQKKNNRYYKFFQKNMKMCIREYPLYPIWFFIMLSELEIYVYCWYVLLAHCHKVQKVFIYLECKESNCCKNILEKKKLLGNRNENSPHWKS